MRRTLFLLFTFISFASAAQSKFPQVDKSPLDVLYYPMNYPLLKVQDKINEPLIARVLYSRPQKNGRKVFGDLISYGKVWRLGANEATEIEFYQPVTINNVKVRKGRYTLYAIPYEEKWTIILNRETDTWGSFKYDVKKDVVRADVSTEKVTDVSDDFSMLFKKPEGTVLHLSIIWDDVLVNLPIQL